MPSSTLVVNNDSCPLCARPISGPFTAVRLNRPASDMPSDQRLSFFVHGSCGLAVDFAGVRKLDALISTALQNRAIEMPASDSLLEFDGPPDGEEPAVESVHDVLIS